MDSSPVLVHVPKALGGVRSVTDALASGLTAHGVEVIRADGLAAVLRERRRAARAILSLDAGLAAPLFPRCVYILHGFPVLGAYSLPHRIAVNSVARLAAWSGARMVAVSHLVRVMHERIIGVRVDRVIYNGCSAEIHALHGRRSDFPPSRERVVLFVGRWVQAKGVLEATEAFRASGLGRLGYRMFIVGGGPLEGRLRAEAAVDPSIEILGEVEETKKAELMARADIFVTLNDFEPMGVVFVEAMLLGCKIVAPHCGGQREFLPRGYPFFGCEPRRGDTIAEALRAAAAEAAPPPSVDADGFRYDGAISKAYLEILST